MNESHPPKSTSPAPPPAAERRVVKLAPSVAPADPRLPSPGTAIVRRYKGRTLRVLVQGDGFEYEGERYGTLSAVAKHVTGSHLNGFRFFRLQEARP